VGAIMMGVVILVGLLGPLVWDMNLVYVSSSPLNLPPAWIHREQGAPSQAVPTPEATATKTGGLGGSSILELMQSTPDPNRANPSDVGPGNPTGDPAHPLGTDDQGRDILALIISGAPSSLRVGVIAASVGMLLGILLGFSAGFL